MPKRTKPEKELTRKQIALGRRQQQQRRYVLLGLFGVGLLIILVAAYGIVDQLVLQPARPVAIVNGTTIRTDDYQARVRFNRYLLDQRIAYFDSQLASLDPNEPSYEFAKQYLQQLYDQATQQRAGIDRQTLDQMVEQELARQKGIEIGLSVTDEEINDEIRGLIANQAGLLTEKQATATATSAIAETATAQAGATATAVAAPSATATGQFWATATASAAPGATATARLFTPTPTFTASVDSSPTSPASETGTVSPAASSAAFTAETPTSVPGAAPSPTATDVTPTVAPPATSIVTASESISAPLPMQSPTATATLAVTAILTDVNEFNRLYASYLQTLNDRIQFSEANLRAAIAGDLWREKLAKYFADQTPRKAEQAHIAYIRTDSLAKAEGAVERLSKGEDFAIVATQVSSDTFSAREGGDIGWFLPGDLASEYDPKLEEVALSLAPGTFSQPITSTMGSSTVWYVVKLIEKAERELTPYQLRAKQAEAYQSWLNNARNAPGVEIRWRADMAPPDTPRARPLAPLGNTLPSGGIPIEQ